MTPPFWVLDGLSPQLNNFARLRFRRRHGRRIAQIPFKTCNARVAAFPPREFAAKARIPSLAAYEEMWKKAAGDIEKFWGELAQELHWFKPYQKVLDWQEPFAHWFVGGQTNVSYNCLDKHLGTPRRTKPR